VSSGQDLTIKTSKLRGPVEEIPGLSSYLAGIYLPLAGGTVTGELFIGTSIVLDINSTLDASKLGVGTVPDDRLSANVTLLGNTTTGTGSVVRATSPTLVTPNLGSATCVTINGAFIGASGLNFVCGGNGVIVASDKVFGFSNSTNPQGTRDVTAVRNATGPTLETRSAGGLKVCNADGSAVGPVQASTISLGAGTKSAVAIQLGTGGAGYGIYSSNIGSTPGFGFAIGGTSFIYTSDVGQGFNIHSGFAYGWGSGAADSAMDTRLTRSSAGVIDVGTTSDNALGSLNLANLTASGGITFGPRTKSALLATSATATSGVWRITDSTPAQRLAYPDGTNWRYMSDDTVVT